MPDISQVLFPFISYFWDTTLGGGLTMDLGNVPLRGDLTLWFGLFLSIGDYNR